MKTEYLIDEEHGQEIDVKFDNIGNCIYRKFEDDFEEWAEYNNDKITHYKNSYGDELFMTYDENGKLISEKTSERIENYANYFKK